MAIREGFREKILVHLTVGILYYLTRSIRTPQDVVEWEEETRPVSVEPKCTIAP